MAQYRHRDQEMRSSSLSPLSRESAKVYDSEYCLQYLINYVKTDHDQVSLLFRAWREGACRIYLLTGTYQLLC